TPWRGDGHASHAYHRPCPSPYASHLKPLQDTMRPVDGMWPYLGGPRPLFRFRQPSGAAGHVGRVNVIHGGVTRHPSGVSGLEPVAGAAMDAGSFQNIG